MGKSNSYRSGIYTSVDGYGIKEIGLEYKCARFNFRLYFFKVRFQFPWVLPDNLLQNK